MVKPTQNIVKTISNKNYMMRCAEDHFYYHDNRLYIEDVCVNDAIQNIPTPCYIYSTHAMHDQLALFQKAISVLPHTRVFYAVKANSNVSVIKHFSQLGAGMDVVSAGEIQRIEHAHIPTETIVFSGVGKTSDEIDMALHKNIHCFNVESVSELELINQRAKSLNIRASIAIRINPDIAAGGNDKISTGRLTDKFGIDAKTAHHLYQAHMTYDWCDFNGIAMHIGSQIMDMNAFDEAYAFLASYTKTLSVINDITIRHLDLGGGLGVNYDQSNISQEATKQKKKALEKLLEKYSTVLKNNFGDFPYEIHFEPGRFLVANTGVLLTRIIRNKSNDKKHFTIVDAAMNDLIRPTLYAAHHSIHPIIKNPIVENENRDIVGPICETGDFLAKNASLTLGETNDTLAIFSTGAYGAVQAGFYNTRPIIAEYMLKDHQLICIRKPYTITEQLEKECIIF